MRVDLPAPFSPRSACTSPRCRSKSTLSSATTPGNRFVMPLISRTGEASTAGDSTAGYRRALLDGGRDLDLARDDLLLDPVHLVDQRLGHRGVDLAEAHAAVRKGELEVLVALEVAVHRRLDHVEDAEVDLLDAADHDALRVVVLILVDADPPDVVLRRRGQRAEAAAARQLEASLRALRDLLLRHGLAEVRLDEVARVAHEHLDARVEELRAVLVARDPDVHGRNVQAADRADHLLAALLLRHLRGEVAHEAARLIRRVVEAHHVRVVGLEDASGDAGLRGALRAVVGDRELRIRELRRDLLERVGEQEARGDRDVRVLARRGAEVGRVVGRGVRLQGQRLDAKLALRAFQSLELRLVERAVVELADVADEGGREIRVVAAARGGRAGGLLAAGAAAARREKHSCDNHAQRSYPHGFFLAKQRADLGPAHCFLTFAGRYLSLTGIFSVPLMILVLILFIAVMNLFGTAGLILPTLMPPLASVNCKSRLPLNLPVLVALITLNTPRPTFLTPLVRTRFASLYWSLSTPMPQMWCWAAAVSVPRPQPPATWKRTFAPCEIWFSATVLQRSDLTKSPE